MSFIGPRYFSANWPTMDAPEMNTMNSKPQLSGIPSRVAYLNFSVAREPCASLTAMKDSGWDALEVAPEEASPVLPAHHHYFLTSSVHISARERSGMSPLLSPWMFPRPGLSESP